MTSTSTSFCTIKIKGRKLSVGIDRNSGEFFAEVDGEQVRSESLRKLKGKVSDALSRQPLDFPCIEIADSYDDGEPSRIRYGTVVGIHSGNNNLIVRWDNEARSEQFTSYRGTLFLPDTDVKRYEELRAAQRAASEALTAFVQENKLQVEDGKVIERRKK